MQAAPIDTINFKDIDIGYEAFAQALRSIGFDWQIARSKNIHAFFVTPTAAAKQFFLFPANESEALTEYAVVSFIWTGIGESVAVIKKERPGKIIKARRMLLDENTFTFEVS
jgi:hypothetical protein